MMLKIIGVCLLAAIIVFLIMVAIFVAVIKWTERKPTPKGGTKNG